MAPCSAKCKKHREELLANQMEQRTLVFSHVVTHAAKVASANTNLLKGILEACGQGEMLPEESSVAAISTLRAEIKTRKVKIAQSKFNLQQRERQFTHPLNDACNIMSEAELQKWRSDHRRLAVMEGRKVKELEKKIIWVAIGREVREVDNENSVEDQGRPVSSGGEVFRMQPNNEEEKVLAEIEMENPGDDEENTEQATGNPANEVMPGEALNIQKDNGTMVEEDEVVEVGVKRSRTRKCVEKFLAYRNTLVEGNTKRFASFKKIISL